MKIVGPTIVEPWRDQIEDAKTLTRPTNSPTASTTSMFSIPPAAPATSFISPTASLSALKPRLYERMETEFKSEAKQAGQMRLSFLSAQNFHGLDILPLPSKSPRSP